MARKIEPRPDFDFDNALERAREDPVAAADELRAASTGERLGNELTGLQHIATGCEIFQSLQRGDEQERSRFFQKVEKAGVKHRPRKYSELTRILLYGMPHASYTTASKAAGAAQWLMNDGAQPKDIPARIKAKKGGIEALYNLTKNTKKQPSKNAPSRAAPTASVTGSADAGTSDPEFKSAEAGGNDKEAVGTEAADQGNEKEAGEQRDDSETKTVSERGARPNVSKKDLEDAMKLVMDALQRGLQVLIVASPTDLCTAALGTDEGDRFRVEIENEGEIPDGLTRLTAIHILGFWRKKPKAE